MNPQSSLVYFDGVCNLCNGFVDFLIKADKNKTLRYSSLQSHHATVHLPEEFVQIPYNTFVFQNQKGIHLRGRGIIEILVSLGFPYSLATILRLLPSFALDGVYNFIAVRRYAFFGKRESCRLPAEGERTLFLE